MYRSQSPDTSERVDRMLFDAYRQMPPWEKLRRVSELSRAALDLAAAGIRSRYPTASDEEVRLRLAARVLGADLANRAAERRSGPAIR